MSLLPYKEFVTANNEISTTSTTFTDALQKDFQIFEKGSYKLGVVFQWSHFKKDERFRSQVRVDGVENTNLRTRPYMGGDDRQGDERLPAEIWDIVPFEVGTFDIDFQFSTSKAGEAAFLNYRRLYIERWD